MGAALNLKRGTGRDTHVVLVPQPSDDPNDPCVGCSFGNHYLNYYQHRLNWPRWKKEACFWTLYVQCVVYWRALHNNYIIIIRAFAASLDSALSSMVVPGFILLSRQFGISVDNVAMSFGSVLLGLACFM